MPPGMHLIILPIVFFPFALYAMLAVPDTVRNRNHPAVRFCLGWIVPAWLVFDLSLTKLPHYTLPLYPAIAILAAKALLEGFPVLKEKAGKLVWRSVIGLWLTVGLGLAAFFALLPYIFDERWSSLQIAAGALLLASQGTALYLLFRRKVNGVLILAAGGLCFMGTVFGLTLPSLQHLWISRQLAETAESVKPCENSSIVSASYGEPSLRLPGRHQDANCRRWRGGRRGHEIGSLQDRADRSQKRNNFCRRLSSNAFSAHSGVYCLRP